MSSRPTETREWKLEAPTPIWKIPKTDVGPIFCNRTVNTKLTNEVDVFNN